MKGKSTFSPAEIQQISELIHKKVHASPGDQKKIRNQIRALGFYASDFGVGGGYTVEDFKRVISSSGGNAPIQDLIKKYKDRLKSHQLKDEIYKWQLLGQFRGRPDPNAKNFAEEFRSVKFHNLIYPAGITASQHLATDRTEEYQQCFGELFNEEIDLQQRVGNFSTKTLKIYREIEPNEKLSHHQDERTMATFLTYHNPDKYAFYKDSFYQKYCKLLGIKSKASGEKYVHYLELLNSLVEDYVETDEELLNMVKALIPSNAYEDPNHLVLAQDILYTTLDKAMKEIDLENASVFKISMGDFSEQEIDELIAARKISVHGDTKSKGTSGDPQGEIFAEKMQMGDYFYLCHGNGTNRIKLVGRITSAASPTAYKNYGEQGWLERSFELLFTSMNKNPYKTLNKWWSPNNNSTCVPIPKNEIGVANKHLFQPYFNIEFINSNDDAAMELDQDNDDKMDDEVDIPYYPSNSILYGPPGTGKTFTSISYAVAIIEGKEFEAVANEQRLAVKERFNKYVRDGQVVFTTFHQSLSYEDFIEGIKPLEPKPDDDRVIYKVQDGLFKQLCTNAAFSIATTVSSAKASKALDFSSQYDNFVAEIEEQLTQQKEVKVSTRSGGELFIDAISDNSNVHVRHKDGTRKYVVSKNRLTSLSQAFDDLDKVGNIDTEFREVIGGSNATAYWAVLKAIRNHKPAATLETSKKSFTYDDKQNAVESLTLEDYRKPAKERFVLIIDEINRGNIAQIFGELITLLESSKRLGKEESLDAMLPYSKKRFGVPPNVYIIGTMNTADRSVEALDAALRRRFSFQFMDPDSNKVPEFVGAIPLRNVFEQINDRISFLLDPDHKIGHSYFCKEGLTESDVKTIFRNNIVPLLKEYFYNDYGKIRLILGDRFVSPIKKPTFATIDDEIDRELYRLVDIDKSFHIIGALTETLKDS